MLTNATHLKGLAIRATDGELGTVDEFYFDDETWAIRYLIVETGGWLGGKLVLISPFSVTNTDWEARRLDVALTDLRAPLSCNNRWLPYLDARTVRTAPANIRINYVATTASSGAD